MEKDITLMPGYRASEYRLALIPHHELRKKIMGVREKFASKYQVTAYPKAAFLTLASFSLIKMQEEKLINRLNILSMGFTPSKIDIKDFGSYPDHSLFLKIANPSAIKEYVSAIQELRSMMKTGTTKPHFLREFHFLIAGKLKPWQYEKGWEEYSRKHFTASFIAREIVLLRKEQNSPKFQVIKHFEFRHLPVSITQGELF